LRWTPLSSGEAPDESKLRHLRYHQRWATPDEVMARFDKKVEHERKGFSTSKTTA
jgi:hypothetical protein